MKKLMITALAVVLSCAIGAKELKVLMIGNSFSNSNNVFLPKLVKAEGRHTLVLEQEMIGGCSLERHTQELKASLKDPNHKPYSNYPIKGRYSLPEMISAKKWDIITIQQASHFSWDKTKTQPFADELIAYIREHAPQAEVVIQETWSYRADDPRIGGDLPKWGFDQNGMYERLAENYAELAKKHSMRVIPMGKAVQIFREKTPVKYIPPTKAQLDALTPPTMLSIEGDVVGAGWWGKKPDPKTGKPKYTIDHIHLNKRGEYLQACVWYSFLFGENAREIGFVPEQVKDPQLATLIRNCAAEAVTGK